MRLTITEIEFKSIVVALKSEEKLIKILYEAKQKYEESITTKKTGATKKAHLAKIAKSKKLIEDAINILRLEGKKINASTVAKQAGINYATAAKYMHNLSPYFLY